MTYLWLSLAVLFEVGWAISMKLSHGFSRPGPAAATVVMYLLSVVFLSLAARRMELGAAYAMWAGSGVALISLAGVLWFHEPVTLLKAASILLIALGIAGVNLAGGGH